MAGIVGSFWANMTYTAVAVLMVFFALKFLNWHNGVKFSEHVHGAMQGQPLALALYYGLRFIGICMVAAALLK